MHGHQQHDINDRRAHHVDLYHCWCNIHDRAYHDRTRHDDNHGGNNINEHDDPHDINDADLYDFDGPGDDRTDHDIAGDDHEPKYVLVRRTDLINLHAALNERSDPNHVHVTARTLVEHAEPHDGAADKPDHDDAAMRAYLIERARYDAGISDNATIFAPLRDTARTWLASHG